MNVHASTAVTRVVDASVHSYTQIGCLLTHLCVHEVLGVSRASTSVHACTQTGCALACMGACADNTVSIANTGRLCAHPPPFRQLLGH